MTTTDGQLPILLVDDDVEFGEMMREFFDKNGYQLALATSGPSGLEVALSTPSMLIILDAMLPGLDGFTVLHQLRKRTSIPIIMLTARITEDDRIRGLDAGADDYLTKPFGPRELLARVRALLRRSGLVSRANSEILSVGSIRLSTGDRIVKCAEQPINLTDSEFDILEHLMRVGGRVVTRRELMTVLHQCEFAPYDRSLDVHISHLRKKLGTAGSRIRTIRGEGYALSLAESIEV